MKYYIVGKDILMPKKENNCVTTDMIYRQGLLVEFQDHPRFIDSFVVYTNKKFAQKIATSNKEYLIKPVIEVKIKDPQQLNVSHVVSLGDIVIKKAWLEHVDKKIFKSPIILDHNTFIQKAEKYIAIRKKNFAEAIQDLKKRNLKRHAEITSWEQGELYNPSKTRLTRGIIVAAFALPILLVLGFAVTTAAFIGTVLGLATARFIPVHRRDQNLENTAFIRSALASLENPEQGDALFKAFADQVNNRDVTEGVVWQWQAKKLKKALEKPENHRQKYLEKVEKKAKSKYNRHIVVCLG